MFCWCKLEVRMALWLRWPVYSNHEAGQVTSRASPPVQAVAARYFRAEQESQLGML